MEPSERLAAMQQQLRDVRIDAPAGTAGVLFLVVAIDIVSLVQRATNENVPLPMLVKTSPKPVEPALGAWLLREAADVVERTTLPAQGTA